MLRQLPLRERPWGRATTRARDRIYVFTPQATIVGCRATQPVDFAYTVHTDLGHRCRGARIDGAMVPLNTPLRNGQTVEVITTKEGGPSMDWLNPELGYLKSSRAKAKVRAWFNALVQQQTIAKGGDVVEKLLQREGRTAVKLEDLARQLGFKSADALFDVVGKDEYSLRNIEQLLRPSEPPPSADEVITLKKARTDAASPKGGVLGWGWGRCSRRWRAAGPRRPMRSAACRKARAWRSMRRDCSAFRQIGGRNPERDPGDLGRPRAKDGLPVDMTVWKPMTGRAAARHLRFRQEKMNVIGVNSQSVKDKAWMTSPSK
jgi:GTP pyrophosphokinase